MNMNPSSSSPKSVATDNNNTSGKKARKPYTITKSRESWTEEEHDRFLEALQLFDRDWKKIEDYVGTKSVIQIRSHAQKYFLKVQKNGSVAHVPPPRPKRKAVHPYPHKASRNALAPLPASLPYPSAFNLSPGTSMWDEAPLLIDAGSTGNLSSQDDYIDIQRVADIGFDGVERIVNSSYRDIGSSNGILPTSEIPKQGIPDFAEVYGFIGSVFDPQTNGHVQKLKEMDPINFETVLLLMRNLTFNLSSPDFEPIVKVLSSYAVDIETEGSGEVIAVDQNNNDHLPC